MYCEHTHSGGLFYHVQKLWINPHMTRLHCSADYNHSQITERERIGEKSMFKACFASFVYML